MACAIIQMTSQRFVPPMVFSRTSTSHVPKSVLPLRDVSPNASRTTSDMAATAQIALENSLDVLEYVFQTLVLLNGNYRLLILTKESSPKSHKLTLASRRVCFRASPILTAMAASSVLWKSAGPGWWSALD